MRTPEEYTEFIRWTHRNPLAASFERYQWIPVFALSAQTQFSVPASLNGVVGSATKAQL